MNEDKLKELMESLNKVASEVNEIIHTLVKSKDKNGELVVAMCMLEYIADENIKQFQKDLGLEFVNATRKLVKQTSGFEQVVNK